MIDTRRDHGDLLFGASIVLIIVLCLVFGLALLKHDTDITRLKIRAPITEDDPRWNCQTMGNRICGPTTTRGR